MATRSHQRGLSLVEAMVGLAIGLLMTTAAAAVLGHQAREHRGVTLAQRLLQDLRTASDIVARDLRRAGRWGDAASGLRGTFAAMPNPYAAAAPATAASDAARYAYSRDTAENQTLDANEQFGVRLRRGVLELQLGADNWQALTDAGTLEVTAFEIVPAETADALPELCPVPCPDGSACAPQALRTRLTVRISARAVADPAVLRTLVTDIHLRNDRLVAGCAA